MQLVFLQKYTAQCTLSLGRDNLRVGLLDSSHHEVFGNACLIPCEPYAAEYNHVSLLCLDACGNGKKACDRLNRDALSENEKARPFARAVVLRCFLFVDCRHRWPMRVPGNSIVEAAAWRVAVGACKSFVRKLGIHPGLVPRRIGFWVPCSTGVAVQSRFMAFLNLVHCPCMLQVCQTSALSR